MRMDKQGKGGSNAVDEEEKRQMRVMDGRVRLRRACRSENVHASAKGTKRKHERESQCPQQRHSTRYTTISAITGSVIRENTVVKKVPRDMVRVSPS